MARRQARRDRDVAEPNGLAVRDDPVDLDRGEDQLVSEREIAMAAALELDRVGSGGKHPGAGPRLDRGEPAGMVLMRLAVEQEADSPRVEAEPADIGEHGFGAVRRPGVEQDHPLIAGDQEGGLVAGADRIEIAGDPERFWGSAGGCRRIR